MRDSSLFVKIYGSLLGGLIGDAMGAPAEGKTYEEIAREYGKIQDFEGMGTDDTIIKHILCEAILDNDGYVTADELAVAFSNNRDKFRHWYTPVRNMFRKVDAELVLPVYAGMGNQQSSSSAMAIAPMGWINACNPRQAALETYDVAGLIHAGVSTFCRDGACAVAAAVAEAMKPEATVESVLDASTRYLHRISSSEMTELIAGALDLARREAEYEAFREAFYQSSLPASSVISDSRETVPCSLALFYLARGDVRQAIVYAANFGRDADTIGAMTGAVGGALQGVDGLGSDWITKATAALPGQDELARKLAQVAVTKAQGMKEALGLLDRLQAGA
jgi:ADP-ribosylglycohydrolase